MTKWVTITFGENAHINRGGSPRPIDTFITDQEDGINWIKIGDIDPTGKYVNRTSEKIIPEGKKYSREVHKGDFILSNSMSFGRPYILNIDGCIHDGWLTIQDYEINFDTDFLYYLLSSDIVKKQYLSMASGSTVLNLNKEKVAKLQLSIPVNDDGTPDLAEQRRIAGILSSADGTIAASEALIAKYRNIKRGLLATLLQPKEEWKKVKLGECLKQKPDYGINAPAVAYDNKLPTYLRITDITEDGYYSKNDVVSVADPDAYKYKMEEGDLVFARTGASVGKTYLYNPQDGILVFAGFLIRVKTDEDILLSSFFKYQTQTPEYKNWIANNSMRTGQPGINGNEYETFSFYLPYKNGQPDLAEQRRIAEILSSVDAKIVAEEKVVEKYKGVKKGLMESMMKEKEK